MKKSSAYDRLYLGMTAGIILPLFFLVLVILIRKADHSFSDYLGMTVKLHVLAKLLSICLVPNLILFFIFLKLNMLKAGRGVLLSMFIAGLAMIVLKVV